MMPSDTPLCPLDDRYRNRVDELRTLLTEPALIRARVEVEVGYLLALSYESGVGEFSPLSEADRDNLLALVENFAAADVARVREIERDIKHDVKAIEYFLRERCTELDVAVPPQFIHFALTSEDVTNLAYGLMLSRAVSGVIVENLLRVRRQLDEFASEYVLVPLLGMTHGQAATPTTIGEQLKVFVARLSKVEELSAFEMDGKFGGAVGNFSAHRAAYPDVDWPAFRHSFVRSLDLNPLIHTAQINPHDDVASLSHLMIQINTILRDLAQDMWLYISRGVLCEKAKAGEVGSSTMPNKVNPLDWENGEGNLGMSTAMFEYFARELPVSRMQRDLSDSTVQRWLGTAFGAHLLAVKSILKGLGKLSVSHDRTQAELTANPAVHAEAIQTVMRRYGYDDAYEQLAELTRGKEVTILRLIEFVNTLDRVPQSVREQLIERIGS